MIALPAIEGFGVTKEYNLGIVSHRMATNDFLSFWRKIRGHDDKIVPEGSAQPKAGEEDGPFRALNDVSFTVYPGDAMGVIGPNGSGKSTLLKLVSKVTLPTKGKLVVRGRLLSMLEVGTGFNPELSGRDNVLLNGLLIGMTRQEVQAKFDEIVEFAEVAQFIDTPVKRYSSGMQVRLAFAVAAHFVPEIIIVDEVLAVGDARFQRKCLDKMNGMVQQGRAIMFVSHNLATVASFCNKGMLLDHGHVRYAGTAADTILEYEKFLNPERTTSAAHMDAATASRFIGDDYAQLVSGDILDGDSKAVDSVGIGEDVTVRMKFFVSDPRHGAVFVPLIQFNRMDNSCAFIASPPNLSRGNRGKWVVDCRIPGHFLNDGAYRINLGLMSFTEEDHVMHFNEGGALTLKVLDSLENPERYRYGNTGAVLGAVRPTALFAWTVSQNDG